MGSNNLAEKNCCTVNLCKRNLQKGLWIGRAVVNLKVLFGCSPKISQPTRFLQTWHCSHMLKGSVQEEPCKNRSLVGRLVGIAERQAVSEPVRALCSLACLISWKYVLTNLESRLFFWDMFSLVSTPFSCWNSSTVLVVKIHYWFNSLVAWCGLDDGLHICTGAMIFPA